MTKGAATKCFLSLVDLLTLENLHLIHFAGFEELEFERRDARKKSSFFEVVLDLRDSKACLMGVDAKRKSPK